MFNYDIRFLYVDAAAGLRCLNPQYNRQERRAPDLLGCFGKTRKPEQPPYSINNVKQKKA